jgi:hypothetical protein
MWYGYSHDSVSAYVPVMVVLGLFLVLNRIYACRI